MSLKQAVESELEKQGWKGRVVKVERLGDLKTGIESPLQAGLLDRNLYKEYLSGFEFEPPKSDLRTRSIIVVAVPQPQIRITFSRNGKKLNLIVPPTYLHWQQIDEQVIGVLEGVLSKRGYRIVKAKLPRKQLAVRSGLAAYGRNNISYVEGMGSFHRLTAFYSDLPCDQDFWHQPVMLEACTDCTACQRSCPSKAIATDRFLLHAERCLTYLNEKSWEVPFPEWVNPKWHNSLVGCMRCQRACPVDKAFGKWVEQGAEFSAPETELLLRGIPMDQLPSDLRAKLIQYDLLDQLEVIPRNVGVFYGKPVVE